MSKKERISIFSTSSTPLKNSERLIDLINKKAPTPAIYIVLLELFKNKKSVELRISKSEVCVGIKNIVAAAENDKNKLAFRGCARSKPDRRKRIPVKAITPHVTQSRAIGVSNVAPVRLAIKLMPLIF